MYSRLYNTENAAKAVSRSSALYCCAIADRETVKYNKILGQALSIGSRTSFRKAASFTLRLIGYPVLSWRWYRFLAEFAAQYQLGAPHDDIIRKAIPNFFLYKAARSERLQWLRDHFLIAAQMMDAQLLRRLWAGEALICAEVAGRRQGYEIVLCLSDHAGARHEGGFTLGIRRGAEQDMLCMMSFIFVRTRTQGVSLAIGGLQGAKGADAKRAVIDVTRDLYGLRPKDALLLLAEGMAGIFGAKHLLAVGNAEHVINFRSSSRRKKMHSDLDHYWKERGGVRCRHFGYRLPLRNAAMREAVTRRDICKLHFLEHGRKLVSGNTIYE